jgi:phosphomannomutase
MDTALSCFKAYDIRGKVPDDLNDDLAFRIGLAYAKIFTPRKVVVGYDIRLTSPNLAKSLTAGLCQAGVDVAQLGLCGTEEVYFSAFHYAKQGIDGGIMVTASHNPAEYNGMKFVERQARPISSETGLQDIHRLVTETNFGSDRITGKGKIEILDHRPAYVEHLLSYINFDTLKPLKIVVNAGNGGAGPVVDLLEKKLPFAFIKIHHTPDGRFPNGVPNPLLPENRQATAAAVVEHNADVGIAWDGDFDRCFLFDEQGGFVEGYYIVGLLAEVLLENDPHAKIIHDPRLVWNTRELVLRAGGIPVMSKTGHAFIKERMREENASYGGEMSAHHYFKKFGYCDSGMIPWLLLCQLLCRTDKKFSELLSERMAAYPVSGEINSRVKDPDKTLENILSFYEKAGGATDFTDGLSMEFTDYRFNVRKSNTEPLLRLNVETRGNQKLLKQKTDELLTLIREQ